MWECTCCSFQNYAALQQCTRCGEERPARLKRPGGVFAAAIRSLGHVPFLHEYPALGLLTIFFRFCALLVLVYAVWVFVVTIVLLVNARAALGFMVWVSVLLPLVYAAMLLAAGELICLAVKGVAYLRQIAQNTLPR